MDREASSAPRAPGRWIAALLGVVLALSVACGILARLRLANTSGAAGTSLDDPEVRRELVTRLVAETDALNDSHPDADVARVLAPSSRHRFEGVDVATNRVGMRERDYAIPKPAGLVRVVVLGDSFVFGIKCEPQERLGGQLERLLREGRGPGAPDVEVLSLGVSSWNLTSAIAYLRRQLDRLQPDLVLHVTVSNDLDDVSGVRGFGALASFAPLHPSRADSLLNTSLLPMGMGWESRTRFELARESVLGLVAALARLPARPRYVLVGHWGALTAVLHAEIGKFLDPDSVVYTPFAFYRDESIWLDRENYHWNPAGNERLARVLAGLARTRAWLPGLALAPAQEAERDAREFAEQGLAEALAPCAEVERTLRRLAPRLDLTGGAPYPRELHGGVDAERLASPYVSILLGRMEASRVLHVVGRALPDSVLTGAVVRVWVEDRELGTIPLEPDRPIDFRAELPAGLPGGPLNVRLEASDYVYRGDDLRHCVAFELDLVALE